MTLNDACSEFVEKLKVAALRLAELAEYYSDSPLDYGIEVDGLRKACADYLRDPDDHATVARLVQLAVVTRQAHDTVPYTKTGMPGTRGCASSLL